jgi:hypothetical protein
VVPISSNSTAICIMVKKALILGLILSVGMAQYEIIVDWHAMADTAENIYCSQNFLGIPAVLRRITPGESLKISGLPIPADLIGQRCKTNKDNKYSPYNLKGPCPKGYCNKKFLAGTLDATKIRCDEYPPASFLEGGGIDKGGRQAAQRCVTEAESKAQSILFGNAYRTMDRESSYPHVTITPINVPDTVNCEALVNDEQIFPSSMVDIPMPPKKPRPE